MPSSAWSNAGRAWQGGAGLAQWAALASYLSILPPAVDMIHSRVPETMAGQYSVLSMFTIIRGDINIIFLTALVRPFKFLVSCLHSSINPATSMLLQGMLHHEWKVCSMNEAMSHSNLRCTSSSCKLKNEEAERIKLR